MVVRRRSIAARSARAALGVIAAWGLGCGPPPAAPAPAPESPGGGFETEAHVLDRTGYGADAWSRSFIEAVGVEAYLDAQLRPASIPDPEIDAMAAARPALALDFASLVAAYPLDGPDAAVPLVQLLEMKILRTVHSRRQLEQVLVDFWFDHFNVYAADAIVLHAVVPFERDAIRPHVLGRFEDMLRAVARHPAMLYYLDNYRSAKDGFVFMGEVRGLNENYARELLELHTVGVDGGYDQRDVIDVARAFTGWTIGPAALAEPDGFFFWPEAHDPGAKSLMGGLELAPGGGRDDGERVIAHLATHPATARFLCTKLVARFVDESPPADTVDTCAQAYLAGGGHLGDATRAILFSPAFLDPTRAGGTLGAKVKRPLHFVGSLLRAADVRVDGRVVPLADGTTLRLIDAVAYLMEQMGEPLYRAHPPTGFPDASGHWSSAGGLITRFKLVEALSALGLLDGVDWGPLAADDAAIVAAVADRLVPRGVSPATRAAVLAHLAPYAGAPVDRRAAEAATLLLSSPEFMQH